MKLPKTGAGGCAFAYLSDMQKKQNCAVSNQSKSFEKKLCMSKLAN